MEKLQRDDGHKIWHCEEGWKRQYGVASLAGRVIWCILIPGRHVSIRISARPHHSLSHSALRRHFDGSLSSYLSASLFTYQTARTLPSSNEKLLKIPKGNLKSVGDRSSSFIAPTVWILLPASLWNLPILSDFKAQLKTFLFQQTFSQI